MKVLFLMLLLLLCSTQVLTLRCYTCNGADDTICKTVVDCEAQYCKTVEIAGDITSRACVEFCNEDVYTTCCQGDCTDSI